MNYATETKNCIQTSIHSFYKLLVVHNNIKGKNFQFTRQILLNRRQIMYP